MRVLLIEDDENKRGQLISFLKEEIADVVVGVAASYHSGLRGVLDRSSDLVLLDMTIPTFDIGAEESGGRSQLYGGREILEQMDRLDIRIPVIVVTQFDRFGEHQEAVTLQELDRQLKREYPDLYCGAVYYNSAREDWKAELSEQIELIKGRRL